MTRPVWLLPVLAVGFWVACSGPRVSTDLVDAAGEVRAGGAAWDQPSDGDAWAGADPGAVDTPSDLPELPPSPWRAVAWDSAADWYAVAGEAFDDLLVVGSAGHALHFNGQRFLPLGVPVDADLLDVDVREGEAVAVGRGGVALRARGLAAFEVFDLATGADLLGVALVGGGQGVAVGAAGTIRRFDAAGVAVEPSNTQYALRAAWGQGPDDLLIADEAGGVLVSMAGTWFREQVAPGGMSLHGLDGLGDDVRVVVGDRGLIRQRDGLGWRTALSNDLDERDLYDVTLLVDGSAWAVGDAGVVMRRDGPGDDTWARVTPEGPAYADADLRGVWVSLAADGERGVAVGLGGALLVQDGEGWRDASATPSDSFRALAALPGGGYLAVGDRGLVALLRGENLVGLAAPTRDDLRAVAVDGDGWAWIAGVGQVHRLDPGTGVWDARPLPGTDAGAAVRGVAPPYACGDHGLLVRWEGDAWRALASGVSTHLHALAPDGAGGVWAAGDQGVLLHVQGDAASPVPVAGTASLRAVAWGQGRVVAVGDHGTVVSWQPGAGPAEVASVGADSFWRALAWSEAEGTWWVGGFAGRVLRGSPVEGWVRQDLPRALSVEALASPADAAPVAVGAGASVWRLEPGAGDLGAFAGPAARVP